MDSSELIERFARERGISDPLPEADGSYRFIFDEHLSLACRPAPNAIIIESVLGKLPDDDAEPMPLLRRLLRLSLGRMNANAEVLCLDADDQLVLYRRAAGPDLSMTAFSAIVETFLNQVERWRTELEPSTPPAARPMHMLYP